MQDTAATDTSTAIGAATPPDTTAPDVQISLRLSAELLGQIDAAARELGLNRAGLIRMTLTRAMRAPKGD